MDARVTPAHDEVLFRYGPGSAAHHAARAARFAASGAGVLNSPLHFFSAIRRAVTARLPSGLKVTPG
jgi:hypothetical protein